MKILMTGFEPFDHEEINPSWEAVKAMPDMIGDIAVEKMHVPVERYTSLRLIEKKIRECGPDIVISVGQAGGRSAVSIERVGINCDDYRIPDNAGNMPENEPVCADGPDAYFASVNITAMRDAVREEGIPCDISNSAGTYVCNHVLYGIRCFLDRNFPGIRSGFIHVPYLPSQCIGRNAPSMPLGMIVKALCKAAQAAAEVEND